MSKLFEQEFILGDLKLFREFDLSQFIHASKYGITNKIEKVKSDFQINYYADMLQKSISEFRSKDIVRLDSDCANLLDNIPEGYKITINNSFFDFNDIIFKPQYMLEFDKYVGNAINDVLNDKYDQDVRFIKLVSGEAADAVKRQVVVSKLGTVYNNKSPKEIIKAINSDIDFIVGNTYIDKVIKAFVINYNNIIQNTLTEANSVLNSINEQENVINSMIKTINTIKSSQNFDDEKLVLLNKISYNAIRGLMNVISFVTFMAIHKLNRIMSNVIIVNRIIDDLRLIQRSEISESTDFDDALFQKDTNSLSEGLVNGNSDAYNRLAENIFNYHNSIMSPIHIDISPVVNDNKYELNQDNFNSTLYNNINKMYKEISDGLDIIASKTDDYLLVFDDMISEAGFQLRLEDRFRNVLNSIDDLTEYDTPSIKINDRVFNKILYKRILSEVEKYPVMMNRIATNINSVYTKAKGLADMYSNNINDEYKNAVIVNELKLFMERFIEEFRVLTNIVAGKLMFRLRTLGKLLTDNDAKDEIDHDFNNSTTPLQTSSVLDFSEGSLLDEIDDFENETAQIFESLQLDYHRINALVNQGIMIKYVNEDGNDTTPTIQDGSGEKTAASMSGTNIVSKSKEWIDGKVDMWNNWVNKKSSKNQNWIAMNKDNLINRSYANVTVKMLPYINMINTDESTPENTEQPVDNTQQGTEQQPVDQTQNTQPEQGAEQAPNNQPTQQAAGTEEQPIVASAIDEYLYGLTMMEADGDDTQQDPNENQPTDQTQQDNTAADDVPADTTQSDATKVLNNLDELINNINGLTVDTINTINTKADIYNKLFTFITGIDSTKDLSDQLENYFKVGSVAEPEVVAISNSDLKDQISTFTIYVDNFYQHLANDLGNKAREVGSSLSTIMDTLNNPTPENTEQPADNTQQGNEQQPTDQTQNNQPEQGAEQAPNNQPAQQAPNPQPTQQGAGTEEQPIVASAVDEYINGLEMLESTIVTMEADNPDEPLATIKDKARIIESSVKIAVGAMFNAERSRITDITKVLASLAPKEPITPAKEIDGQATNNTDNTQQGNEQQPVDQTQNTQPEQGGQAQPNQQAENDLNNGTDVFNV